jgi:hypothetical protein
LRRDEVKGGWRKPHNVDLHNLYSLPNIIRMMKSRRMRLAEHVRRMGEKRNEYRLLVGMLERRALGRPRHIWVDNNKMALAEIEWGGVDWIGLAQDRNTWRGFVNLVMNPQVYKCWETIEWLHNWWPLD